MDKVRITLKLYGGLNNYTKEYHHEKGISLRLNSGETIDKVLEKLGIPKNKIVLITANNKITHFDYILKQGDIIKMFPPIGGG